MSLRLLRGKVLMVAKIRKRFSVRSVTIQHQLLLTQSIRVLDLLLSRCFRWKGLTQLTQMLKKTYVLMHLLALALVKHGSVYEKTVSDGGLLALAARHQSM